ncbi:hypothetical protein KSP40_PGU021026 [Platanthera guangdongensis]|uniref:Uncharacterized protein n=1 Tax=Platanthera guangdongensis TaxID=2320717 RepID=A0ABR2LGQ7_9ASPA
MAKFSVFNPTNHHYRYHLLLPDFELLDPPPMFAPPPLPGALQPFHRGPMYSTYSELRDRNRRAKKAKLGTSTPIPSPLKRSPASSSVSRSLTFTKENRKPSPASAARFAALVTLPPVMEAKPDLRKLGRASVETRAKIISARKSFSENNVLKEISMEQASKIEEEKGRGRRGGSKGILRKSIAGFELSKSIKTTGWIG